MYDFLNHALEVANPKSASFERELSIDNYILYLIQATYVNSHDEIQRRTNEMDKKNAEVQKVKEARAKQKTPLKSAFNSLLNIADEDGNESVKLLTRLFEDHADKDGMLNHNEVLNNLLYHETLCNTAIISSKYVESNRFLDTSRAVELGITDRDALDLLFDIDDAQEGKSKERPTINLKSHLAKRREKMLDAFLVGGPATTAPVPGTDAGSNDHRTKDASSSEEQSGANKSATQTSEKSDTEGNSSDTVEEKGDTDDDDDNMSIYSRISNMFAT